MTTLFGSEYVDRLTDPEYKAEAASLDAIANALIQAGSQGGLLGSAGLFAGYPGITLLSQVTSGWAVNRSERVGEWIGDLH